MKTLKTLLRMNGGGANHCKHWLSAFTLAETLITIGIIGIVAAMTLPAIIDQRQKVVTVNRLKKFYTTMEQAILLTEKEEYCSIAINISNKSAAISQSYLIIFAVKFFSLNNFKMFA